MSLSIKAQIVITFTRDALNGETISFNRTNSGLTANIPMTSTFVSTTRKTNGQIPLSANTGTNGEAEAISYQKYFDIDFNQGGLMTLTRNLNVITINIDVPWNFTDITTTVGATNTKSDYTPDTFQLDAASLSVNPTTPCSNVDVYVLMDTQADSYSLSYGTGLAPETDVIPVTTLGFTVPIQRVLPTKIFVNKAGSRSINISLEQWNENYFYFNKISDENVDIQITPNAFSGATIIVYVDYLNQLIRRPDLGTLQYSLDGVTYSTSFAWVGQTGGNYTVYIKDSFNCIYQKDFVVPTTIEDRSAFFEISERNSLSFSKNETWNGLQGGIHKNENNVLALTGVQDILYDERVILRSSDNIRIQFKSNYTNHNVYVLNCEDTGTSYTPTIYKMSNNLDRFESLDCKLISIDYSNSRAGIYFDSGNRYDINGVDIGDYELNGNLPDSAIIGNYIDLGIAYGVREVVDLIYDSSLNKRLIVFNMQVTNTSPVSIVMKAYYDLLPFEVYEFDLDIGTPILKPKDNSFRVRIQCLHNSYTEINYYSEYVHVIESTDTYDLDKYVAIDYYGTNNRKIFYNYGIKHFMRAEVLSINSIIDDTNEIIKGDLSTYLSESILNKGIEIKFAEVTYRVMMKLSLALSSENLFINGLGYVKKESLTIESIPNTNLYLVSCLLLSTNKNFNIEANDQYGDSEGYSTSYIPKILGANNTNIKI
tara:strand:- start:298 stop:2424 length:2127 start_codon:yes stop_codon:yes gene_type:complete